MANEGAGSGLDERLLWDDFHNAQGSYAREELVRMYEPLARSIAARMYGSRIDNSVLFADYLQYGQVGLVEAIDRFDATRGVSFSAFAASRIRGAILNGLAKESEAAAQNLFWRTRVHERVASLLTAVAPNADRASLAQIATITVGLALGALLEDSLDQFEPADENPNNNPYAANELLQLHTTIKGLIVQLPERERAVICGHYVDRVEFQCLATRMSLTKGRVAQIHAQALLRLRGWLERRPRLDSKL